MKGADVRRLVDAGADFAILGRAAVLHHDWPRRFAADPDIELTAMVAGRPEDQPHTGKFFDEIGLRHHHYQPFRADNFFPEGNGLAAIMGFANKAVFQFPPAEYHYTPIGSVHGGVYATVCDSACGCAVHTLLPAGAYYTSLDLSVRFIRPITPTSGLLTCAGTVENIGGRTALATARLTNAEGKLFAHATSNCLIFRPDQPSR